MKRIYTFLALAAGLLATGGLYPAQAGETGTWTAAAACAVPSATAAPAISEFNDPCDDAIRDAQEAIEDWGKLPKGSFAQRTQRGKYINARMRWIGLGCEQQRPGEFPEAPGDMKVPPL